MNKAMKIILPIICAVLVLGLGCTSFFGIRAYQISSKVYAQMNGDNNAETQEDDVCIADEYYIRSTTDISDAYKSGDTSKLNDRQKQTLDMAEEVIDEVITDDMTDFEKEKAIYDWMCANLSEDSGALTVLNTGSSSDVDNPYGVLKNHQAVCVGYATTFRLFMQMMDIECMVIHNSENYHSWDLVNLDGHWYHTDIYSDVGVGNYAHFNQNDTMRSQEQDWDTSFFPAADALTYNMSYQNMLTASSVNEIPSLIRSQMDNENYIMCIRLDFELDENASTQIAYMVNILSSILDSMDNEETGDYYFLDADSILQEEDDYILYISMSHMTDSYSEDFDDGTADEDMLNALRDAFSDVNGIDDVIESYGDGSYEEDGDAYSYYDDALGATVTYNGDGTVTVSYDNGDEIQFDSEEDFENTIGTEQ